MIGNKFLSVAGASEPTDAQFNYVTMLLHGDGTNGAQNNTFLDSSSNNFTITRSGNTTQGSFSPYGSNWSNYFDGTGDDLMVANNTAFDFGSGDFTLEAWINPTGNIGAGYGGIITKYAASFQDSFGLVFNDDRTVRFFITYTDGSGNDVTSVTTLTYGTWNHVAVTRSGTTFRVFINGTQSNTFTSSKAIKVTTSRLGIGNFDAYSQTFTGYISNARVVKGTAVYTSAFTPSTTPLTAISGTSLLTCQSNRFKDSSSNAFAITVDGNPRVQRFNPFGTSTAYDAAAIGGSGYFDGTGDYLSIANNTAFDMGSGDFTIEGWMYQTSSSGMQSICAKYEPSYQASWIVGTSGTNWDVYVYYGSTSYVTVYTGAAPALNQWNHFALERNGSNIEFYVNGSRLAQVGAQTMRTTTSAVAIGRTGSGYTEYFVGSISDIRIRKGTATYSGTTYPVPTAPLTAATNTSLLCNFTNAAIVDNAMMNDLETVGNAQISTSVKKYGTGSLYFDGTGDYLFAKSAVVDALQLGVNGQKFTVEAWIYPTSIGVNGTIVERGGGGSGWNSTTGISWTFFQHSSNRVYLQWWTGSTYSSAYTDTTLAANTWQHVAAVYDGTTTTVYLNGSALGGGTSTAAYGQPSATNQLRVGMECDGSVPFTGYIDDLRITKGYARTITTPTAAFPNTGPT